MPPDMQAAYVAQFIRDVTKWVETCPEGGDLCGYLRVATDTGKDGQLLNISYIG